MYIETTKLKDIDGNIVSPAEEGSLTLLRRIFQLLKPLGIVTGGGSNRLNIDVNAITTLPTLAAVTTVTTVTTVATTTTVGTVNNQAAMGGIPAFDLMRSMSRTGYANGPRANLVIT
jgi:hypothetical protein